MKYFILMAFVLIILTACTYFDPMHGMQILKYGSAYSLSFSGEPALIINNGYTSYSTIKVDGDTIYLVYFDFDRGLILSRSQDGGSGWRDAVLAASGYNTCMDAAEGNVYISYMDNDSLYCIVSCDGGTSIRKTRVASADSSGDGYTGITGYEDKIYISYSDIQENNQCDVLCAYSENLGRDFSIHTVESTVMLWGSASAIAYNPQTENVCISYQYEVDDRSDVRVALSSTLDTWEITSFDDTDHKSSMIIAHDAGTVHLMHSGTGPTYYNSTDDGSTWSSGVDIDPDCIFSLDISFIKDGSILYAAYYDANYGRLKVAINNGVWTPQVVDLEGGTGGVNARKCSIDASDNVVFVSYVTDSGPLMLSKSTDGGLTWNTDE